MDIRTLYLTLGITYLVVPIGIYQVSRNSRDHQLVLWCGSWALTGIGAILIGVRGSIPDFFSYLLAHTLFMGGYVLRINALLLELKEEPTAMKRALMPRIAFAALYLMIFSLTVYLNMNEMSRLILVSAVFMLNFIDLVWVGIQIRQQRRNNGSLMIIAMGVMIALGFAVRIAGALTDTGGDGLFGFGVDQVIFLLLLLIGFIIGNLGFLQIRLEKLWLQNKSMIEQLSDADELNRKLEAVLQEKNTVLKKLAASSNAENAGVMMGAISHELTQPLHALQLNAGYLRKKIEAQDPDDPSVSAIRDIVSDADRLTDVVVKIRKLFQRGHSDFKLINLAELLDDILSMLGPQLRELQIELHTDLASLRTLHGDQTQLRMAITNIIRNAIEALSGQIGQRRLDLQTRLTGTRIELDITDNGPGVAPALQRSLFDLYDSTKDSGSGIGLWLAHVVIQNHHGTLTHHNNSGGGACFRISLPLGSPQPVI